jgi:hypothetical protein
MKVRHFLAAFLLAFGIGQHAYAEEQAQPDAQQAPAMQKGADETAAKEPVASQEQAVASAAAAPSAEPAMRTEPPAAIAQAASTVPEAERTSSFLHEVKITDVIIAVFAGLLVLLGWIQSRRMREAVRAATESATVAGKSARTAEEAMISGQRAFMFIREIQTILHQDAQSGKYHWTIHPIWANSGNTPTRGLTINTTYRLLDEPLPQGFEFPQSGEEQTASIAGPRSMVEATPGTISSEDLKAVQEGKKFFYIWGWAEYHDIFEGTGKRITRFCNQLIQVDGDTAAPANEHTPIQMMFGFHAENNYAN